MRLCMKQILQLERDNGIGLEIEFQKTGDRFGHEIRLTNPQLCQTVLRSAESDDRDWPSAPPLQQISRESHGGHDVMLGIGMAHQCHWSVAFVPSRESELAFEIQGACRAVNPAGPLCSTYDVPSDCVVQLDQQQAVINCGEKVLLLSSSGQTGIQWNKVHRKLSIFADLSCLGHDPMVIPNWSREHLTESPAFLTRIPNWPSVKSLLAKLMPGFRPTFELLMGTHANVKR